MQSEAMSCISNLREMYGLARSCSHRQTLPGVHTESNYLPQSISRMTYLSQDIHLGGCISLPFVIHNCSVPSFPP